MAIGMILELRGDPAEMRKIYHAVNAEVNPDGAPAGLILHVAGPTDTGWRIADVWESQAAFDTFSKRLFPAAQKHGMKPDSQPLIWAIENTMKARG
jgi:hypothetical protein